MRLLLDFAHTHGYPLMLKRTDGGGGRGITLVHNDDELRGFYMNHDALQGGDLDEYFVERFIDKGRHVETQCGRDSHGNFTVYSTRDCSVQRRNQKLVEEAPAPFLSDGVLEQLETYSRRLFEAVDYIGLGTCEFMVTEQGKVYFLEVNPRLQVEHTVSEEVCGLDLVREQLTIANGGELTVDHPLRGHSFELRLTCEDPAKNLAPSSGTLTKLAWPSGPGIRVDSGVVEGDTVSPKFDSMMGKLVVTASDRAAAVARVRRALEELKVEGVPTPASLFEQIFNDDEFTAENGVAYDVSTKWLERKYLNKEASSTKGGQPASMAGASGAKEAEQKESSETFVIEVNNHRVSLTVPNDIVANLTGGAKARDAKRAIQPLRGQGLHHVEKKQQGNDGQSGVIASPMQAVVTRINVAEGQDVAKGDLLVVLESTTYPGTTEELCKPILEKSGLKCGEDFYLAFSPERVDPGNLIYKTKNTPKVVGGCTPKCTEIAAAMYETVLEAPVYKVSSPAIAEMEKILENTYRNVNIGLINELAILCDRMGINIWEVIDAAKSKPYGFQAFYPGPGLGGHCIPLDPYYLSWKAREYGFHTSMIESSMMVNDRMPEYCVDRAARILNTFKKSMNGAKILLGVAYKQNIADFRESPAINVIKELQKRGADVSYYDPWVPSFRWKGMSMTGIPALTEEALREADLVMVTTAHTNVDYAFVQKNAKFVFDTKNAMKAVTERGNIEVL